MSGTSMDGVDGVLLVSRTGAHPRVLAHAEAAFGADLRAELFALNQSGANELHRAALAGNALSRTYAQVVENLLCQSGVPASQIRAIGAHGQTVRHQPQMHDGCGYTLQIQNPALLAELTGITVVADFRSRDVAAGGQGAPLVPRFHQALLAQPDVPVAVLNLGGIANLTVLPAAQDAGKACGGVQGFDTGPANVLLDAWCLAQTGRPYDEDGRWGAAGQVLPELLERLLAEPYFTQAPPKSTGRDLFNNDWLGRQLGPLASARAQDVQATLAELTVRTCAAALRQYANGCSTLMVCGGGARNALLMQRLQVVLGDAWRVCSTRDFGIEPQHVEAAAFAWLAQQCLDGNPGNLSAVTGAKGPRILGAVYR